MYLWQFDDFNDYNELLHNYLSLNFSSISLTTFCIDILCSIQCFHFSFLYVLAK